MKINLNNKNLLKSMKRKEKIINKKFNNKKFFK